MKNILEISNLSFSRGNKQIFSSFSMQCPSDKPTLIVGDNGIGKSTLLNLIAGIEVPDSGSINFNDSLYQDGSKSLVDTEDRKIGFIFQDFGLFSHLTVKQNIHFVKGDISEHEIASIINVLGLGDILDKDVDKISGGQQQRTAIARTLVSCPAIILADEPFSNLDEKVTEDIQRFLIDWTRTNNQILILIAHNTDKLISDLKDNTISLNQK
jgi:iron(III) transport system ATP-binding protein